MIDWMLHAQLPMPVATACYGFGLGLFVGTVIGVRSMTGFCSRLLERILP